MLAKVLIIDDEDLFREDLATLLTRKGYDCRTAASAEEGLGIISDYLPDIVLSDIVMPGKSGVEILDEVSRINPTGAVIIMTAFGSLETAIEAFRKGAVDYILKPLVPDDLFNKLQRILEHKRLLQEIRYLRREIVAEINSLSMVGQSAAMERVMDLIRKVAPTNSTVLITGESGTGKEVVAQAIHEFSEKSKEPFVAINCSGLQENLLESELFGHVKGAFTGASRDKAGFFEVAASGTLFLDEISEMPVALQSKLLRVLEQREYYRVGGTKALPVQARIVAATNRNLKNLIKSGDFREDLYYRIAVFEIDLPPLRQRRPDIPLLVEYFIRKFNKDMKRNLVGATSEAIQAMMSYEWPGNIRELRNVIERGMILSSGQYIELASLPLKLSGTLPNRVAQENLREAIQAFERGHITQMLNRCGWNKEEAARRLEINPSTLYRKMADLNIKAPTTNV